MNEKETYIKNYVKELIQLKQSNEQLFAVKKLTTKPKIKKLISKRLLYKNVIDKNKNILGSIENNTIYEKHEWDLENKEIILHLECLKQKMSNNCGYHTIYNSYLFLLMCSAETDEESDQIFKSFHEKSSFYFFFIKLKNLLKQNVKNENGFPWDNETINSNIIERSYIDYLLKNSDKLYSIQNNIISIPDITRNSITIGVLTLKQMIEIEKRFDEIKKSKNTPYALFLGALNHWYSLIINKFDDKIEFLLIDSRNTPYLDLSDEKLMERVLKDYEEKRFRQYGKEGDFPEYYKNNFIKTYHESCKTIEVTLKMIYECISGKIEFVKKCLDEIIIEILNSYNNYMKNEGEILVKFKNWLKFEYHPEFLYDLLFDKIDYLKCKKKDYQGLINWFNFQISLVYQKNDKIFLNFLETSNYILKLFK
jgi:hypothetical protein